MPRGGIAVPQWRDDDFKALFGRQFGNARPDHIVPAEAQPPVHTHPARRHRRDKRLSSRPPSSQRAAPTAL